MFDRRTQKNTKSWWMSFLRHLELENKGKNQKSCTVTDDAKTFLYRSKTTRIFGWIEFVMEGLQPFSVVENPTFRKHSRFNPIARTTHTRYLETVTSSVEDKIGQNLPSKFVIVFDGWSCSETHYVAIYAMFPYATSVGYRKVLLGFSPFEVETSQRAQEHYEYTQIHSVLVDADIADIENYLLSPREDKQVHDLCKQLGDLNSVTKFLQSAGVTFSEVRTLFDEVIHDHPDLTHRLSATADISKDPVFDMAICKLQDEKELGQFETSAFKSLKVEQPEASLSERDEDLSLAARALKRRKLQQRTSACYVDSRFVVTTSNMCENSVAGYALNGRRKRILPINFEAQIFIHENREM